MYTVDDGLITATASATEVACEIDLNASSNLLTESLIVIVLSVIVLKIF